MDYKLALLLKDVGFPQIYHTDEEGRRLDFRAPEVVAVPYLEELIEACKDVWFKLENSPVASVEKWTVQCCNRPQHKYIGSSPSIAVARLWLALNKKV